MMEKKRSVGILIFAVLLFSLYPPVCYCQEDIQEVSIEEILQNHSLYAGEVVIIKGRYGGRDFSKISLVWKPGSVSWSHYWQIYDDAGCLYVAPGVEVIEKSGEIDRWKKETYGTETTIKGIVEISEKNMPYIKEKVVFEVSAQELVSNPTTYLNRAVQVEGIVKFVGEFVSARGEFYLENDGYQISVSPWVPFSVAQAHPSVKVKEEPKVMGDFVGKRVKLKGLLEEVPKMKYINKKRTIAGTHYAITCITDVSIIH